MKTNNQGQINENINSNIHNPNNSNVNSIQLSYKVLDKPTGQVLHITSNETLAQFLHSKYNAAGYNTIVLVNK